MATPPDARHDSLYLQAPLEYRVQLPVLGIPVQFATNDRSVLDFVEELFGHWRGADVGDPVPLGTGAEIRLYLHEGDEGPAADARVTFRVPDPMRWIVHTPGSVALADLDRRAGVAYVTRALLADRARFRVSILQFLVLIILTAQDRTPVHAAMIARGDAALLLAGPTGTGKSTLAYAASKAGLSLLSDDAAFVQLEPRRVWGSGTAVLLLEDAAFHFPELAGRKATLFPTGKRKVIVASEGAGRPRYWVTRAGVCVLARSSGPVRVTRVEPAEIRAVLTHDPEGRFGARLEQAATWLSANGGWRLSLATDPAEALPHLHAMLDQI